MQGADIYVGIGLDDEFEPGNYADNQAEIDEAVEKIRTGEWAAYKIAAFRDGEEELLHIVHGYVTDAGYEGCYSRLDQIKNDYLRDSAQSVLDEAVAICTARTARA